MELNDYEKNIVTQLGYNIDDFDIGIFLYETGLRDMYYILFEQDDQNVNATRYQHILLATSYYKRLIENVLAKREATYQPSAQDPIDALLEKIFSQYKSFDGMNVSLVKDEEIFQNYLSTLILGKGNETLNNISSDLNSAYDEFYEFLRLNISSIEEAHSSLESELYPISILDIEQDKADEEYERLWKEFNSVDWSNGEDEDLLSTAPKKTITNEDLIKWLLFLNSTLDIIKIKESIRKNAAFLFNENQKKYLESFLNDSDFMTKFTAIMEHDNMHTYHFHGTTCLDDAMSICQQGLVVNRSPLSTTAEEEMTMERVILYKRGGRVTEPIGESAVVIIDEPKEEQPVLETLGEEEKFNLVGSGQQGIGIKCNYIVRNKYIVGYVDKVNKDIIFNPEYYDYERFKQFNSTK